MPLVMSRKRALSVPDPSGPKKRKVASKAGNHHLLEPNGSQDIEDTASFTALERKQVLPVLQPTASWLLKYEICSCAVADCAFALQKVYC